jgi:hypothetical protein
VLGLLASRPSLCAAKSFAGATGSSVLSGVAKCSFGFVVGSARFRMQHERKQLAVAHQSSDFLNQVVELMIGFVI